MNKCSQCHSCLVTVQIMNNQYKFCNLCLRIWKLSPSGMEEINPDTVIDNVNIREVIEYLKKKPL